MNTNYCLKSIDIRYLEDFTQFIALSYWDSFLEHEASSTRSSPRLKRRGRQVKSFKFDHFENF